MKITTLVPAFKPKYLNELLVALRHQTVRPQRIIFSDDSPGRAFRAALQSEALQPLVADLDITIIDGPQAGGYANVLHLLKAWGGSTDLVHFLLDDDVIYPDFYERHLIAHATGRFNCSISRRWTAVEWGQPVGFLPVPEAISRHPHRILTIDANMAFATTVPQCNNWKGEYSNAVFRSELAELIYDMRLADISFRGLEDIGTFLCASLRTPLCFINEHLGYFRLNPGQNSQQVLSRQFKLGTLAWFALALAGRQLGQLSTTQAAECFARMGHGVLARYRQEPDMTGFCDLIPGMISGQSAAENRFLELWSAYVAER